MEQSFEDNKDIKHHNIKRIFKYIYLHKSTTKLEITRELNLSLPTVTNAISYLLMNNLIVYNGVAESTGGRKAHYLTINANYKYSIGIAVTLNHIRIMALDFHGNIIGLTIIGYSYKDISSLAKLISETLEVFINSKAINRNCILGVNVAIPALLSSDNTLILFSSVLRIYNTPVKELIKYIPYRAIVSNDAFCGGYCELLNQESTQDLIYLSIDRGIGGAFFFQRSIVTGDNNCSANFGHMCIHPNGVNCACGKNGCFEVYCSTNVLTDTFHCKLNEFFSELSHHNQTYDKVFEEYLTNLAIGISNIKTIFDQQIIIGGELSCYSSYYSTNLEQKVKERLPFKRNNSVFSFSKHGFNSSCMGASLFLITSYIDTF